MRSRPIPVARQERVATSHFFSAFKATRQRERRFEDVKSGRGDGNEKEREREEKRAEAWQWQPRGWVRAWQRMTGQ